MLSINMDDVVKVLDQIKMHLIAFAVDDGLMPEKMQIKIIVEDERENHEETHRLFPAPGAAGSHDRK